MGITMNTSNSSRSSASSTTCSPMSRLRSTGRVGLSDAAIVKQHHAKVKRLRPLDRPASAARNLTFPQRKAMTLRNFECLRRLGTGGWGAVCLVRIRGSPQSLFAVKIIPKKALMKGFSPRSILAERKHLVNMPWSPFVTSVLDTFQDKKNAYLLLEYMPSSTLAVEQTRRRDAQMPEQEAQFFISNIVLGLQFLHSQGIVHCDLKPDNILVGNDGYLTIVDFGVAKNVNWAADWESYGSPEYMPPEVLSEDHYSPDRREHSGYAESIDWWSLGCIAYEMVSGSRAFCEGGRGGDLTPALKERIKHGRAGIQNFVNGCPKWMDFVDRLLCPTCDNRLGFRGVDEVKSHAFLSAIDWNSIETRESPAPQMMSRYAREHIRRHTSVMLDPDHVPGLKMVNPPSIVRYIGHDLRLP